MIRLNPVIRAWAAYQGLWGWFNWPAYISNVFLRPGLTLVLFALIGKFALAAPASQAYMISVAVYSIPVILLGSVGSSMVSDLRNGTLSLILSTRANRISLYFERLLFHLPNALLTFVAALVFAWLFFNLELSAVNWPALLLVVLAAILSSAALSLLVATLLLVLPQGWNGMTAALWGTIFALSGVIIPTAALPVPFRVISEGLPITHIMPAARLAFAGAPFGDVAAHLSSEFLVALGYAVFGCWLFLYVLNHLRRTGGLDASHA